jgi:hypothetical protein
MHAHAGSPRQAGPRRGRGRDVTWWDETRRTRRYSAVQTWCVVGREHLLQLKEIILRIFPAVICFPYLQPSRFTELCPARVSDLDPGASRSLPAYLRAPPSSSPIHQFTLRYSYSGGMSLLPLCLLCLLHLHHLHRAHNTGERSSPKPWLLLKILLGIDRR